ncbi:MAG: adenylyl-sulfate kinase [Bacteroidota bacterium]|nr:adenylyl-sulfate kinase [Bacteroidota bacterium]
MDNIFKEEILVSKSEREKKNGHKGTVLWFTGLSGSGKSTIAKHLQKRLFSDGIQTFMLDGDNIRLGLNKDLSFSGPDRLENIRRIAEVAHLFSQAGMIALCSFISPSKKMRDLVRNLNAPCFYEFFVKCSLETCERRDPKGLYAKARKGEIPNFTGISAPYEVPENPDLILDSDHKSISEIVEEIHQFLKTNQIL